MEAVRDDVNDILSDRKRCCYCAKTFSSLSACRRHESRHKSRKRFQCKLCKKSYTRAEHLQRHLPSHTGVKDFKCDSCEKQFSLKSHLVQHLRTHSNERPYKCTECNMAFRQIGHLQQHSGTHKFQRLSTGGKRTAHPALFVCSICDKALTAERSLKSHVRTMHTNERPNKCKECDETFHSRQKYFYHKQTCHEDPRYDCPDCGRHFPALWMMKRHNLLHTSHSDYVCPECGRRFREAVYLRYHLLRHGEAQTCHVCGKLKPNPAQLQFHVKCHLLPDGMRVIRRKLFDCGECGKQFSSRKSVIRHFTAVHVKAV